MVIDDYNVYDRNIDDAYAALTDETLWWPGSDAAIEISRKCLDALSLLTFEERMSALAINDGYFETTRGVDRPFLVGDQIEITGVTGDGAFMNGIRRVGKVTR